MNIFKTLNCPVYKKYIQPLDSDTIFDLIHEIHEYRSDFNLNNCPKLSWVITGIEKVSEEPVDIEQLVLEILIWN